MNAGRMKKLVLNRETVRTLQDRELSLVAGGATGHYGLNLQQVAMSGNSCPCVITDGCPCGSTLTDTSSFNQY